ncbi:MAG TPA: TolC family protein [Acidobacteriota bacterium]|nr:TolC family protein [Acidobacteriota bacterium]
MAKKTLSAIALLALLVPALAGEEVKEIPLTLEDSIVRALKNNLNLAVEVFNPELADATLARAKEAFLPILDLNYDNQNNQEPPYWFIQGAGTLTSKLANYGASVFQRIPTGGTVSVSLQGYKSDTNQAFQLINPRYGSTLRFDFTQPLLRDFGPKVARREILVSRNNLDISRSQLETILINTVYQVQEAYWNLVYAIEDLNVKKQSLQLARDLLAKNKKEVEVGTLAPLEVLNAEATVAQREADILQAEALIRRGEDVLKSLVNPSAEGDMRALRLVPTDKPALKPTDISLDEALAQALESRPELAANKTTILNSRIDFSVARNQLLPKLDLKLSYWSPGISGDRIIYLNNDPFLGVIIGKEKGGSNAFRDATKFLYRNWTVGLTLSVAVADVVGRANYALARLALDQNMARLKNQEQQISLEVGDAVRSVETDAKRVDAYRIARELAAKRLEAETKKLGVGLTTNYFVLQYQEELATARSMEIKALVDYNLSLSRLEKAVGSSLRTRNITVADFDR